MCSAGGPGSPEGGGLPLDVKNDRLSRRERFDRIGRRHRSDHDPHLKTGLPSEQRPMSRDFKTVAFARSINKLDVPVLERA